MLTIRGHVALLVDARVARHVLGLLLLVLVAAKHLVKEAELRLRCADEERERERNRK